MEPNNNYDNTIIPTSKTYTKSRNKFDGKVDFMRSNILHHNSFNRIRIYYKFYF